MSSYWLKSLFSLADEREGWCVNSNGIDQNTDQIFIGKMSKQDCWKECQKDSKALGCEWRLSNKACYRHEKDVADGQEGESYFRCLVLKPNTSTQQPPPPPPPSFG